MDQGCDPVCDFVNGGIRTFEYVGANPFELLQLVAGSFHRKEGNMYRRAQRVQVGSRNPEVKTPGRVSYVEILDSAFSPDPAEPAVNLMPGGLRYNRSK